MTHETEIEIIRYLQEHNLPPDEGTYPPELLAPITIKAFEELFQRIGHVEQKLEDSDQELMDLAQDYDTFKDNIQEIKSIIDNTKGIE